MSAPPPQAAAAAVMASTPRMLRARRKIVGKRRQAELGAHVGEAAHQERALMHPLLDAAERMLDDLAPTVENLLRGRARSHGRAPAGGARLTNHSGRS